MFTEILILHV